MPKTTPKQFKNFLLEIPNDVHHVLKVGAALHRMTLHDFILFVLSNSTETEKAAAQLVSTQSASSIEVRAND